MTTEPGRSIPRWRRVVLPASIILNLFFVALIGGHLWRVHNGRTISAMPPARALRQAEAVLPPQDAAAFGAVMRRDAPQYMEAAHQLRQARAELQREIMAQEFNQTEVQQRLAAWQTAWNRFMGDVSGPLVEALAKVSPEGRRKLIAKRQAAESTPSSP